MRKEGIVDMKFYRKISKKKIKSLGILVIFIIIPLILSTPLFKFNNNFQENLPQFLDMVYYMLCLYKKLNQETHQRLL